MSTLSIPLSRAYPGPYRPHPLHPSRRRMGQGRPQAAASAASVTCNVPETSGTITVAMATVPGLRNATPTAVIFTLNHDIQQVR